MNTFAKVLVVIVLLLSSGFAISQMLLYSKREMWRGRYERVQQQLDTKTEQLEQSTEEAERLRNERDRIKQTKDSKINRLEEDIETKNLQISKLERRNEKLQTSVDQARARVANLEERLDDKEGVITELETKVDNLDGSLKQALGKVENLSEEVRAKANQIDELDQKIAQLQKEKRKVVQEREDLESMLAQLEAKGIHVGTTEVPIIDAKVIRVDNELGAVVINRGKKDGVQVGYPFTIYRDEQFVARVYIMEVHEDYSLGRVDKQLAQKAAKVGDEATTRIQ